MNLPHCRALTKKSASNFAPAFRLLPRAKRDAMAALYAFCRAVDDVADEDAAPVATRRRQLAAWRDDIRRACENRDPQFALNQEFQLRRRRRRDRNRRSQQRPLPLLPLLPQLLMQTPIHNHELSYDTKAPCFKTTPCHDNLNIQMPSLSSTGE